MVDVLSSERRSRVTGSRIAGILGLSPYRTRSQVMREMVREFHWADEEFAGNVATEWGKEHEPDAIEEYQLKTGRDLIYTGDEQHTYVDTARRLAVTPDGIQKEYGSNLHNGGLWARAAVEVKCPYRALYTSWEDRPDYQQQCHLVAELLGLDEIDFAVWRPSGFNLTTMPHDETWWPSVADEVEKFLTEYDKVIDSEELSHPFLEVREGERDDEEWSGLVAEYYDLVAEAKRAGDNLAAVKQQLQDLAGEQSAKGAGLHVIYRRPAAGGKGSVKYKNVADELFTQLGTPSEERAKLLDDHRGPKPDLRATWAFKPYEED